MSTNEVPIDRSSSIRLGAIFPQTEMNTNPREIARYAVAVEAMGFNHLLAFDHVVGGSLDTYPNLAGRYTSESLFHEIFVLFGFLAAVTDNLELTTGVVILPQRQTVLVAKQAAEVDVLSEGRLRLGLGIGWNEIEFTALNENFRNRASRFEEQIALMQLLWSKPVVDFDGKYHTVHRAGINPLPTKRSIPLWIGGTAEPAVRRAARLVDGFISSDLIGPQQEQILRWLQDELARNDRSFNDFGLDGRINLPSGNEDDWRQQFEAWQKAGASHISFYTKDGGLEGVDAHLELLDRAQRAVEPLR